MKPHITKNSHGRYFQHHRMGGTYPVNDGDPQNDVDDFDENKFNNVQEQAMERANEE